MAALWLLALFPLALIMIGINKKASTNSEVRKNGKILILTGIILYGIPLLMGLAVLAVCSS